ncbi:MAG: hypothetical protein HUU35_15710, partial [Armatimonadetes bacterium]|nr:hypothetical protein [Armatimonadota bacterium]
MYAGWQLTVLAAAVGGAAVNEPARGPLRVHPTNPRYFTDGSRQPDGSLAAVYLTGSHTWDSLVDIGPGDPPAAFDFEGYLARLATLNHNFIRLWTWDSSLWDTRANGALGKEVLPAAPLPWARTGPGVAADGRPKFDLTRFDPAYFERLRGRVLAAGEQGIYVSVMLFEGWGLLHANKRVAGNPAWAWRNHPFHPNNNINGIDGGKPGDPESGAVHSLTHPEVNKLQAAYLRHVAETLNDLDNLLYEVINEGGVQDWNWWVVEQIHAAERALPQQHPVGLTGHGTESAKSMLASPAEWVSPGARDGYRDDPPAWNETKVSLLDTDHIWGVGGNTGWVWKSLTRGHNPIFMDPWQGSILRKPPEEQWEAVRRTMGAARRVAQQLNMAAMAPHGELASSGYCLAEPGRAYLVYLPGGGEVTV